MEWLAREEYPPESSKQLLKMLISIAHARSEEALNRSAKELEGSELWKSSRSLREWFTGEWLAEATVSRIDSFKRKPKLFASN